MIIELPPILGDIYFTGNGIASPFVLTKNVRQNAIWMPSVLAI